MSTYQVSAEATVPAPASLVYEILADYHEGHASILPPEYFHDLDVEQGGTGRGTIVRFQMHVLGRTHRVRASVSEPEPGRVLKERDLERGTETTFAVTPYMGGRVAHVAISTTLSARGGPLGALERWLTTSFLRKVYAQELWLLQAIAEQRAAERTRQSRQHARILRRQEPAMPA